MLLNKTKFANDHGVKSSTVQGWMQRHWTKGVHYYVIGRTTMIDTEEFERWIRSSQQVSDHAETGYKSESGKTEKKPTKKRSRATHSQKVTFGGWQNSALS